MRMKKTILLLAITILSIIAGSHWVSKKVSGRTQEENGMSSNIKKEEVVKEESTTETVPLDDETFVDTSDRIRVALHTTNFTSLLHNKVEISCDTNYVITIGKEKKTKKAGEVISFVELEQSVTIVPKQKKGKLTILSVKRSGNYPVYRGTITLYPKKQKIIVVNELSMEEYLYGVVPSEMPVSYGNEALKVQAICARTYAMAEKNAKRYEEYHADVVDSTASQVYKNTEEDGRANQAVRDTKGIILIANNKIASTYFFSTSCGYTTNVKDVWYQKRNEKSPSYLTGQFQGAENLKLNLKKEKDFRTFIKQTKSYNTFEKNDTWYRWKVSLKREELEAHLLSQYANKMKKIGQLTGIKVIERGEGGVVKICKVIGKKGYFFIEKEYEIRKALGVKGKKAIGQNKKEMTLTTLLPSGYFYITQKKENITLYGGGFGHGVGMSQTGAMRMAEKGYQWKEIIEHYFPGVEIKYCYS